MKTVLKTLICTALCCAAWSAFATPPAPTTVSIAFKGAAGCAGPNVGSVTLNGPGTPDVYVQATVTSSGSPVPCGKAQISIATDATGKPTSSGSAACWVNITGSGGVDLDSNGQACFPVDLDNLAALGLNCMMMPLQNVTCPTGPIGFQIHFVPSMGCNFHENFSPGTDLTINCAGGVCGSNTNFTIGYELSSGPGNPCPGSTHCWTYIMKVQNCTATDLTNVKIQGGLAAWINQSQTQVSSDVAPMPIVYQPGRSNNRIVQWIGNIPQGTEVNITVTVCGTVSRHCDTVMGLSGNWSATGTDANGNTVTTGYTGTVEATVDCNTMTCVP
jgi:hypothetical protein